MESLKEFNYYNVKGEQIKNPDHTLQYDKKDGKLLWFDAKNDPAPAPLQWRVAATNAKEQEYLNNEIKRGTVIGKNQIATPEWLAQKQALQNPSNTKSAQNNPASSQEPANTNPDPAKSKTPPGKSNETLIVDNLVNSGTLQKEITKAVVNAESIPILAGDLPRISAAISKALISAEKTGLFDGDFLLDEGDGEIVNTGQAKSTTADTIVSAVLNKYLSVSKSPEGKSFFTYTFLPEEESLQEAKGSKKKKSSKPKKKGPPSPGDVKNNNSKVENSTTTPGSTSPENQIKPSVEEAPAQKAKTIILTSDNKRDLKIVLKNKVTEMLSDVLESFKSTAALVKYHCRGVVRPSQAEAEKLKKTPAVQTEEEADVDSASQTEETSQEVKEPAQEIEEAIHSNDYYVFTSLVEAKKDKVSASDKVGTVNKEKGKPAKKDGKEEKKLAGKDDEKKEKPSEVKAETPVFPTTEALKTFIEGLNKAGNTFEADLAVYNLSYTLGDIDTNSLSFDILVESTQTTPKEGFWESFGKELKRAGAQIASYLAGNRGHMDI